jgi:hypothetical protein
MNHAMPRCEFWVIKSQEFSVQARCPIRTLKGAAVGHRPRGFDISKSHAGGLLGHPVHEVGGNSFISHCLFATLHNTVAIRIESGRQSIATVCFTYLLHKGNAGWKIHEIIATDLDK